MHCWCFFIVHIYFRPFRPNCILIEGRERSTTLLDQHNAPIERPHTSAINPVFVEEVLYLTEDIPHPA